MTSVASSFPVTTEVVRTLTRLKAIRDAWERLPQARQSPLLDHVWTCVAADTLHDGDALHIVLLHRGAELVAAAPLVAVRRYGITRLQFLGVSALNEPTGLLYADESALQELLSALLGLRKPMAFQRVELRCDAMQRFLITASACGRVITRPGVSAPYVEIAAAWQSYVATLSSRRRYDYRRNRKRLEEAGQVLVTHHSVAPEFVSALFARFVTVEAAGWKSASGSSLSAKATLRSFFEAASHNWAQAGSLRISFLTLQGQDVAAVLWLAHADRAWVLKIGYDERWADASPGVQLLWEVLQSAFEQRFTSFEFLGNDEPWLSIWTTTKREYQTVVFYPYTVLGWFALAADALAALGRRAARVVSRRDSA